jgi:hypothetical protein
LATLTIAPTLANLRPTDACLNGGTLDRSDVVKRRPA